MIGAGTASFPSESVFLMVLSDPVFDELLKLFCFCDKKVGVCFRRDICHVVVNLISLAAASIKIRGEGENRRAHGNLQRLECRLMVPQPGDPVAFKSDYNLRKLENRVVGGGEAAVI